MSNLLSSSLFITLSYSLAFTFTTYTHTFAIVTLRHQFLFILMQNDYLQIYQDQKQNKKVRVLAILLSSLPISTNILRDHIVCTYIYIWNTGLAAKLFVFMADIIRFS